MKVFSTLNFSSSVLTDIDTMALKEKKCDRSHNYQTKVVSDHKGIWNTRQIVG